MQLKMFCVVYIIVAFSLFFTNEGLGKTGLFLSLNNLISIDDDSFVDANADMVNDGLLCHTNRTDCCSNQTGNKIGDWLFPNGSVVNSTMANGNNRYHDYFYRKRGQSVIRLIKRNNPSERGRFCCKLVNDSICVNILNISPVSMYVSPSVLSTTNITAGERVYLQCSADILPHPLPAYTSTPEFEWFIGQTFSQPLNSITTNNGSTYSSILQIPSSTSERIYTCRLRGNHRTAVSTILTVVVVNVMVQTSSSGPVTVTPSMYTYSLTCNVTGAERLNNSNITYQWFKDDEIVPNQTMETFSFTVSLSSDAGGYTCQATIMSSLLRGPITTNSSNSVDVTFTSPAPTVSITSDLNGTTNSTEQIITNSIATSVFIGVTVDHGLKNVNISLDSIPPVTIISGITVAVLVAIIVTIATVIFIIAAAKRSRKPRWNVAFRVKQQHGTSGSSTYQEFNSIKASKQEPDAEIDCGRIELKEHNIASEKEENKCTEITGASAFVNDDSKAVPVSEFSRHVERLHADEHHLLEMEYMNIPIEPQSLCIAGQLPLNRNKNRFGNIFPYDASRVTLKKIPGEEESEYINASYINGYNKQKAYIAAQGPMPDTISDFWRMIWEKRLPTVVMLTRCFEGKKKCEEYWPVNVGESVEPGHGLNVALTSMLPFAEYSIRKIKVTQPAVPNSVPLKLTQFHFTGWPDHDVPQNGVVLLNFIKRVRSAHPYTDSRPLLVHCSAGVGRTGAFIVLDSMLQRMKIEEDINILEFVTQLRAQRVLMVQTQSQYNFIHDALNELILCGDTEISVSDLKDVISQLSEINGDETGYSHQFQLINQMSQATELDYTQANLECNISKNRYVDVLPNDRYRVMLCAAEPGYDYINASFVDGYRQRGAYIATQTPMENTMSDFWRMIWEYKSRSIVVVNEEEAYHAYLPRNMGEHEVYGTVSVKLISQENSDDYIIRQLEVSEDKPVQEGSTPSVLSVTVFHYMSWPKHATPLATSSLLELMEYVNKAQMSSGNRPITVMCNDGVGQTGTFICIHAQLERLKTEGVVDIFQFIKSARIQRAGLVSDIQQYMFCHSAVADYLDGFDTYANFKKLV